MSERIRFGEPVESEVPEEDLPPKSLLATSTGGRQEASFQVYIVQSAYADIWRHINETPSIESGGVLVGHPFKTFDGQTTFVVVTAAIPQHSDNRSVAHFTVGPTEIAAARARMEHKHAGLIPVGWYHSHPGHGVFLSGQDMTIVRSIYNASWNIAMVLDPRQRTEGIFVGPEGRQLGARGNDQLNSSWIGLRQVPDSVRAIALYSQAREALDERRPEDAREALNKLQALVQSSEQLRHWRERGGYRDVAVLWAPLEGQPVPQPQPIPVSPAPPQPARPTVAPTKVWLGLSALATIFFAVFFSVVAVFWPQKAGHLGILAWGVLLSLLAVVAAGYVIFSREAVPDQPDGVRRQRRPTTHFAIERLAGLILIALVILTWGSYVFLQTVSPSDGGIGPMPPTPFPVRYITPTTALGPSSTLTPLPTLLPGSSPTSLPPQVVITETSTPSETSEPVVFPAATVAATSENGGFSVQTEVITATLPVIATTETP
jgi:proteasome lid subunit RPN8/RPN11